MKQKIVTLFFRMFAFFANVYITRTKPIIIGVTGSVGKTSCRTILSRVLETSFPEKTMYTSPKNYNSEIGLTLSIFEIESYTASASTLISLFFRLFIKAFFATNKTDILVLEYGVDHPGDMDFLLKIAIPDYAVFTQLDSIHAENFSGKSAIGEEKMKLLKAAKVAIFLNKQDTFQDEYAFDFTPKIYWFNTGNIQSQYVQNKKNIQAHITLGSDTLRTNLLGAENFVYLDLAFQMKNVLFKTGGQKENISEIVFDLQAGRFSIFSGKFDSIIIDSSYNAGPKSMQQMIENTLQFQKDVYPNYRVLFVLGDMREIGKESETVHKELYEFAITKGEVVSVGKQTAQYFGKHLGNFKYAQQAGQFVCRHLKESSEKYVILFKGSQNTIFLEEAIQEVLKYKKDQQQLVRQESYWKKKDF